MVRSVKKYIIIILSIVISLLIGMFTILIMRRSTNDNIKDTSLGIVNDIKENIIAPVAEENTITENNIVENQSVTENSKVEDTINKDTSENKKENVPKTKTTSNTQKETTTKPNTAKQEYNNKKQSVTVQGSDEKHSIKGDEGQWYTVGDWFELDGNVTFIEN